MKKYTRFLALLLSVVMLVSVLPVSTVNASAAAQTQSVLSVSNEELEKWGVIGNICGSNWDTDFEMTEQEDGSFLSDVLELHAGEEFKVRQGGSWDVNYGADGVADGANITVSTTGKYQVKLTYHLQGQSIIADNGVTGKYTIVDLVKGEDGNYYTPDTNMRVYIAVGYDISWCGNYSLYDYVDAYGTAYFGLERWEELVALMDKDGLVPCNDKTLVMLSATTTTNTGWGETDEDLPNYLVYEVDIDGTNVTIELIPVSEPELSGIFTEEQQGTYEGTLMIVGGFTVKINSDNTVTFFNANTGYNVTGTATVEDGVYKLVLDASYGEYVEFTIDGDTLTVTDFYYWFDHYTATATKQAGAEPSGIFTEAQQGTYTVSMWGDTITLVVNADGTVDYTAADATETGLAVTVADGVYSFTFGGETLSFTFERGFAYMVGDDIFLLKASVSSFTEAQQGEYSGAIGYDFGDGFEAQFGGTLTVNANGTVDFALSLPKYDENWENIIGWDDPMITWTGLGVSEYEGKYYFLVTVDGLTYVEFFFNEDGTIILNYMIDPWWEWEVFYFAELSKEAGGVTPCAHTETEIRDAIEATVFAAGYTGDTYCKLCGEKIAEGEVLPARGCPDIAANSTATAVITTGGQYAYFRFVATKDGQITFYSTGSSDTYGYILDASGNYLSSNDDSGSGLNFSITYEVSAGTTYYLAARFYDGSQTGSFDVYLLLEEYIENSDAALVVSGGLQTYTLFNSGRTGSASRYSSSSNPAANTLSNNGYDIYATTSYSSMRTVQLGLPFTIEAEVLEQATLSIYAYDVDESYGERDYIYLYDETTDQSTKLDGYLSGMDGQWNTTVFKIDPSLFEVGHSYHFLLNVYVDGWVVYVRNVSIELPCGGSADDRFILSSDFSATIDANGMVSTTLSLATSENSILSLEYAATYDSIRYGATTETFATTSEPSEKNVSFYLQSGAPKGTYSIHVIVKRANGSIVTTFTTVASTVDVCSVSYNANGGSQNLPHDSNAYVAGDTVTVRFDYLPGREGYIFLGWARDRNASVAEFTQEEGASFQIFADTTLYAVWGLEHAQHTPGEFVVDVEPDCVNGGSGHTVCAECGETINTAYIPATGHSYAMTESIPATCTQSGSITYTCANCGDSYSIITYADHCYELRETQAASCTEAGYKRFVCSGCGATYTEEIPAGQHSYVSELIEQATTEHGGLLRYTCSNCGDSYDITTPALKTGVNILLVQDRNAWETRTNVTVLNKLTEDGYIAGWSLTSSEQLSQLDLSVYGVILIADDQYASTYQSLSAVNEQLTGYVNAGGVLIYGACDNGWTNGNIDYALPGGTRKGNYYSGYNYIVDAVHPIVTAALTDGKGLTNELLHHNYCSHTYFTDLPENAKIILQDSLGMPTLAEYTLGNGTVIVNGLTWEHAYKYLTYFGSFSYSTTAYDDMIVYAATLANGHTHAYDAGVEVQPTCTEKGYTLHTCSECGMTYRDNFVDALGHTPGEWSCLREASCTQSGVRAQICVACGEVVCSENIPATSHSYAYTATVDPDCENDGYVLYVCTNEGCGAEKRDCLIALGHDYGDDNICDHCGHTLPYIHNHKYSDTVVEPSCSEMGYTLHACACGASYRDDYMEPRGHSWDEGVVTDASSCALDGTMLYTCTVCGQTRTQSIPAAHDWTEILITQATCDTDGEKKLVCKRCGEEQLQTIPAGHSWDEGVVTKEPSCVEEGTKECTCTVCGSSEEQTIAALGHEFYCGVCIRCGIKFIDIVNDDLAHPEYGMYFELDDVISNYGPALVNEYGVLLNYNTDAQLDKVAVYLTQDGTMWRRCIACTGSGIEFATYVPYLSYDGQILYSGLNSEWINTFSLRPNADGIWNYSNYATIGVNLEDCYGQLLLSLYSIGNAGAKTRVFDDLDEMIAWLSPQTQHEHSAGEWEPASIVDGKVTQIKRACTQCGETLQYQNVKAEFYTSETSGRYQDSISLDIYVKAGSYLADMQMNFCYDSDMFEVESVEFADGLPGLQMATVDPDTQQIRLIYSGTACLTEDTHLVTVRLKIKANVVYRTEKAIWLDEDAYNICHALLGMNTYELNVELENGFGNVSILGIDPNGDGELNIFDLYAMLVALSSPDYACDDERLVATMDCNGDGIFDVADLTYLQQMIVDMG